MFTSWLFWAGFIACALIELALGGVLFVMLKARVRRLLRVMW